MEEKRDLELETIMAFKQIYKYLESEDCKAASINYLGMIKIVREDDTGATITPIALDMMMLRQQAKEK